MAKAKKPVQKPVAPKAAPQVAEMGAGASEQNAGQLGGDGAGKAPEAAPVDQADEDAKKFKGTTAERLDRLEELAKRNGWSM